MSQVARNLSDAAEGFLIGKRYLIHDRDPLSGLVDAKGENFPGTEPEAKYAS